ncbi:MAG: alpha/beta hydrolase [Actinobacteria bacterium]|jgi:monoterpene epsilon-lactone hydrolase|nr:alpha/beta hydrolase [Actinomycetota bacterium]
MPSTATNAISAGLGLLPDALRRAALTRPLRRRRGTAAPRGLSRLYDVSETPIAEGAVVTARSRRAGDTSGGSPACPGAGRHLFYLHGGAYTLEDQHWPLLGLFIARGWTVHLVDYPLAPEHTVDQTVPMTLAAWQHVVDLADGAPIDLAGDSAGGGLALVLLQEIRGAGLTRPSRTVLLSPWVDAVMADPATVAAARDDVLLSLRGLHGCIVLYRGDRDPADPWLSPINGGLHDLGEIRSWVGTAEMFQPQCERLADLAASAPGTDHELRLGHDLLHDWGLFPVPERDLLVDEMVAFFTASPRTSPGG